MRWLSIFVFTSGCAIAPTTYHPFVAGYAAHEGYQDVQLDGNTYKVVYWWNTYTSEQRGQDLLLYRCGDLTLQHGFDYFAILEDRGGARVIRMFHGKRPNDSTDAFDARELMMTVGQRLGIVPSGAAQSAGVD